MDNYANQYRLPHIFNVGDKVWLSTNKVSLENGKRAKKLNSRFCETFKIFENITDITYRLEPSEHMNKRKIHYFSQSSLLKLYNEDQFHPYIKSLPPIKPVHGSEEYEVDSILSKRKKNGRKCILLDAKDILTTKTDIKQLETYQTQSSHSRTKTHGDDARRDGEEL